MLEELFGTLFGKIVDKSLALAILLVVCYGLVRAILILWKKISSGNNSMGYLVKNQEGDIVLPRIINIGRKRKDAITFNKLNSMPLYILTEFSDELNGCKVFSDENTIIFIAEFLHIKARAEMHHHDCQQKIIMLKGKLMVATETNRWFLKGGEVFTFDPGVMHEMESKSRHVEMIVIFTKK